MISRAKERLIMKSLLGRLLRLQFSALVLLALGASSSVVAAEPSADPTTVAHPINLAPGPEYADSKRMFQAAPGIERSANGRLWATWISGGVEEGYQTYAMLSTSDDDGKTWSLKVVVDPDRDGPVWASNVCLWHDP